MFGSLGLFFLLLEYSEVSLRLSITAPPTCGGEGLKEQAQRVWKRASTFFAQMLKNSVIKRKQREDFGKKILSASSECPKKIMTRTNWETGISNAAPLYQILTSPTRHSVTRKPLQSSILHGIQDVSIIVEHLRLSLTFEQRYRIMFG